LNECAGCGYDFTSVKLFDRHRVGRHEPDERRCLTVDEMEQKGWQFDSRSRWSDPARTADVRARLGRAA
jgi:hypothetical protein